MSNQTHSHLSWTILPALRRLIYRGVWPLNLPEQGLLCLPGQPSMPFKQWVLGQRSCRQLKFIYSEKVISHQITDTLIPLTVLETRMKRHCTMFHHVKIPYREIWNHCFDSEDRTACGNQAGSFRQCVLHVLKLKVKALWLPRFLWEKRAMIFNCAERLLPVWARGRGGKSQGKGSRQSHY